MMSATILRQQKLYGLFELDESGVVLYYRVEPTEGPSGPSPIITGRNFFNEIAPFENVDEFRLRLAQFIRGVQQADIFNFTCQLDHGPVFVKVLLARVRERSNGERTKSILVHIRKA